MKLDTNNPGHAAWVARYLSGEMEDDERQRFEDSVHGEEENDKLLQMLKKNWDKLGSSPESRTPDTLKAWDKLHSRLNEEQLIPSKVPGTRNFPGTTFLRLAALVLILISVGVVLFLTLNDRGKGEMVNLNTQDEMNTLIKTLDDGSIIYLAQNSTFSFPKEFARDQRNVLLKGEAFFDIHPDAAKPFIIQTDEAEIEVLGTAFNVRTASDGNFELSVDRGKVKVTLRKHPAKSEYVIAGQKVTAVNHQMVKSVYTINSSNAWYTHRMHFKDEPLENILKVLNRNFNATFAITKPEIGNRRLTVTFENETVETMTELICLSLNLKSQVKNDTIVLSDNKAEAREN
jgi:ferric-dicitrate binding protein FerR (iron transport regulator)